MTNLSFCFAWVAKICGKVQLLRAVTLVSTTAILIFQNVDARPVELNAIERVRQADVILLAKVTEVHQDTFIVTVRHVYKGMPSGNTITVSRPQRNIEQAFPVFSNGDQVALYGSERSKTLYLLPGAAGGEIVSDLKLSNWEGLLRDIQLLLGEASNLPGGAPQIINSNSVLISMLKSGARLRTETALDYIYRTPARDLDADLIRPEVLVLLGAPDATTIVKAIQVLRRIGDKNSVPLLINLVGSNNNAISDVAFSTVRGMVAGDFQMPRNATQVERHNWMLKLREWWSINQDRIRLVY